ncbi:glycosyltransferase [Paenibacillus sp. MER 99-2]|uniref:glycosyltransferase n=1 Tax=Paenibacillus sp. MER 99-2 TaxID=2939572 RepID=UPI002041B662|nr:glycosyltransferase [Paenibacillus sp. MER 99-2]MCM3173887.1 glycosyltransferase [Paenibacillus sp. MER 99-2]
MPNNLISLCMIVKDEEQWLPQCLDSVQAAVDEIIIVDTGSSDRSVAIAKSYGAMVVHLAWSDDFAAARNAGLARASGDWILFLDADEALDQAAQEQIRSWTAVSGCDGLFLNIHNYTGSGEQGATVNPVLRLFRNAPEHRFEGRIHEQIAAAICRRNPEAAFHLTDMIIHHYGYQTAVVEHKDKVNRNLRLLEQAVKEEPEQPFHHYNLGVEYLRVGEAEQALKTFGVAKAGIDPTITSYAHLLCKYEIRCLEHLNRWQEALEHIDAALELFPDYTDLIHHRGVCEDALGHVEKAEFWLREAVRVGAPPPMYHTEEGLGTYQTWYTLGRLLEGKADLEGAVDAYVEAVRAKSSLLPPLYRIFRIMRVSGQEQQIPQLIKERFALESEEAIYKVLGVMEQSRCYEAAVEWLTELTSSGDSIEKRERLSMAEALLQIQRGKWKAARLKLEPIQRKKGLYAGQASRWLDRLHWAQGRPIAGNDGLCNWLYHHSRPDRLEGEGHGKDEESNTPVTKGDSANAGYEGWQAFGLLMEGCVQSGQWGEFHALIQMGRQQLATGVSSGGETHQEQAEEPFVGAANTAAGTSWLVRGLLSAADEQLRDWSEGVNGQRQRCWPLVQRLRLELPGPDGFGS